ncbi:GNAT family N-acetyltransferase [Glaciecola sp. MH2013]|uniref:GNAT family N-acetyltransferase n=1 Tax=Glaciecola sp. MH2013 TaxID=2785524 RepID=UPI00189CBB88|nr:GNAT family N-acetyltransferase [Glaciecola sp. MH2013]MBF7074445.1 GNAT family N-acetyltransferase [Glaciecola sp. MH2013]
MILREFVEQDRDRLLDILNDPEVTRFLSSKIPAPYTFQDASWWIDVGSKLGYINAIEIDGTLVGCIGVDQGDFEYYRSGEIGYWLDRQHWNKGIMTKAVHEFVSKIFNTTEMTRIFASVFSGNTGSMKLLTKCGFEQEGIHYDAIFKDQVFYNNHVFAIRKIK